MNQINPIAKAWSNAEKTHHNRERGKVRWKKRMIKANEFLDGNHRYERTFSDDGVGEFKIMNGRDAKKLNDRLFEDYLVAMDKNVPGRSLERWKVTERFIGDNDQADAPSDEQPPTIENND